MREHHASAPLRLSSHRRGENAFAVLARANALIAQGRDIMILIRPARFRTPDFIVRRP
jgi:hypothetical protein